MSAGESNKRHKRSSSTQAQSHNNNNNFQNSYDDIKLALQYTEEIKSHLGIAVQHAELVHETEAQFLKHELYEILEHLTAKKNAGKSQEYVVETVFNTIKSQLYDLMKPAAVTFLASTSSAMFKILAPIISNYTIILPENSKIEFSRIMPKKLTVNFDLPRIPPSVTKLTFEFDFNKPLKQLPNTITHITFGYFFNQCVDHLLPLSLTHLTFGGKFNQIIDNLPTKLTNLTFGTSFNLLVNSLPPSVTHLIFGASYNQPLLHLPPALQVLQVGPKYNQFLENLPDTLTSFVTCSSKPITKLPALTNFRHLSGVDNIGCTLPTSITQLVISGGINTNYSNLPLTKLEVFGTATFAPVLDVNTLPNTLTSLKILGTWNQPLDALPPALKLLSIDSSTFNQPLDRLPQLSHLTIGSQCINLVYPLNSLPTSITNLSVQCPQQHYTQFPNLPASITHLTLSNSIIANFAPSLAQLPPKLTHFTNGHSPTQLLPPITHLTFRNTFNSPVDNLPDSLTHLTFGFRFDQTVTKLPHNITHLTFGYSFNQKANRLPPKITHLFFGYSFDQKVNKLPATTTHLYLGVMFDKPLYNLPPSLFLLDMGFFLHSSPLPNPTYEPLMHFPPSLQIFTMTLVPNHGKNNGRFINFDEFSEDHFEDPSLATQDCYTWCVSCVFYRRRVFFEYITTSHFFERFITAYFPKHNRTL